MNHESAPDGDPVIVKKYANRRLYNTATSSYVTLDDLSRMVRDGVNIHVQDARTGDDLTRQVLTQIIMEMESRGQNLLPVKFLRQLISCYDDNMCHMVPPYLEQAMDWFSQNQAEMRSQMERSMSAFGFGDLSEVSRRNMALVEQTMRMFNPWAGPTAGGTTGAGAQGEAPGTVTGGARDEAVTELREQMRAMREELTALRQNRDPERGEG